ncbi:peptide ABC transporter ATP-binidng protein [Kordiimonas sediminis]|uniref:Peptide ABC transporter ATP-binidng protein n=1 Tax=Kordiimonas sediminis TaxID=1735581 RepID=A0A919AN28_9PROT|nr:peptidase domain-containing ABC transporter [Kordiimonas sediminis]GHF14985.1 peptide ABC transporter ATP-binidng protein [Kordiimonas sediminis]
MTIDAQSLNKKDKGPRLSTGNVDMLADALRQGSYGSFEAKSAFSGCLFPWLKALYWRGSLREFFEALPHFADTLDLSEIQNVMAVLGYPTQESTSRVLGSVDDRLYPCLFVDSDNQPFVLLSREQDQIRAHSGETGEEVLLTDLGAKGHCYFVEQLEDRQEGVKAQPAPSANWFMDVVWRFGPSMRRILLITFFMNVLALAVPIFILGVYDQVIPIRATDILLSLSVGMGIAFIFDFWFRILRARLLAYVGGRVENIVAVSAFEKILNLPPAMTEMASLGDQVSKLKDFDSLRELFTSLLVTVGFELPFVVMFLIVLGIIAGPLALVPLGMAILYAIAWFIITPKMSKLVKKSSIARARRHGFLVESISNMRTIKEASVEDVWNRRYRKLSADAAVTSHEAAQISFLFQTLASAIMTLSGIVTLAVGLHMAISEQITIGALIASMALTWRILSPIQNLFLTFARAEQAKVSISQINNLMRLREEPKPNNQTSGVQRAWHGAIEFVRVSFKYTQQGEPALLGVGFRANPGDFIAISGSNGSGKSSILRLLLGLQSPQAGHISIDGVDIRQIVPAELRRSMAYVPQQCKLFHGTIAQNIRLGNPVASDDDLRKACQMAGVLEDVENLPQGFDTRVGDQNVWQINSGLRQKLALARAYIADATILLMDEPANALDDRGDKALMETLQALKGKKTIIMVSHRPSHLRLADRLVMLNQGQTVHAGTPDEVFKKMAGG